MLMPFQHGLTKISNSPFSRWGQFDQARRCKDLSIPGYLGNGGERAVSDHLQHEMLFCRQRDALCESNRDIEAIVGNRQTLRRVHLKPVLLSIVTNGVSVRPMHDSSCRCREVHVPLWI